MLNVEVLDQGLDAVEVDRGLAADRNEETSTVEGNLNFKNHQITQINCSKIDIPAFLLPTTS